jgi:hypothetical protein
MPHHSINAMSVSVNRTFKNVASPVDASAIESQSIQTQNWPAMAILFHQFVRKHLIRQVLVQNATSETMVSSDVSLSLWNFQKSSKSIEMSTIGN